MPNKKPFKGWVGGRARADRRNAFVRLREIADDDTRNLLRGLLAANKGKLLSGFLTNRVRKQGGEHLAECIAFLFGKYGAFPFSNQGGSFRALLTPHRLDEVSTVQEVRFVVGHLNGWVDDVLLAIDSIISLAALPAADPADALNALQIFATRWGASNFLAKKAAFVMALNTGEHLAQPFADFADAVQQPKYPAPYFMAMELIDMEFPYFSGVPSRIALFSRLVGRDGYRQVLPLHNIAANPLNEADVGPFLRKSYSMSFIDEIVALAQLRYVGAHWGGVSDPLSRELDPVLRSKFEQLAQVGFDSRTLYGDEAPRQADLAFYRRSLAFLEYPEPCKYRQYVDLVVAPRLLAGLTKLDTDLSTHPKPTRHDLTRALNGFRRPNDYLSWQNVGRFLRTVHFLLFLSDANAYEPLDQHDVRNIFEHTSGLDSLLFEAEIERLYLTADETSRLIVTTLALALYKERSRDDDVDFKFRKSLADAIRDRFGGDVTSFVEWLIPSTPEVANFILSTLDRDTLHKLYWIIKSPDEADATRQNILRAVGKQRQKLAYFIEADAIEAQRRVAKLSKYFDDSRMYVDGLAMNKWLTENPSAYAQQFMRLINVTLDRPNRTTSDIERIAAELVVTAKFDYILVEAATKAFEQFCMNESFGIESYLSRRIRHNTLAGMMRSEVETLLEQPRFQLLNFDDPFVQANASWVARYREVVEHIRRDLLQFRSDQKSQGILVSTISADDAIAKANIAWLKKLILGNRSTDNLNELLVRFCWLQIDPQLKSAARLFSVDMVNTVTEDIERAFGDLSGELGEQFKGELKKLVHSKFARLASWFRQPDTAFVPASTRQIGDLIYLEAPLTGADQPTLEWAGEQVNLVIGGLSVHRLYDCLFVLLRNALKYGAGGPIRVTVDGTEHIETRVAQIHVEVESKLTSDEVERAKQLATLRAGFSESNTAVYMVNEGLSGIKKLRYILSNAVSPEPPSFRVEGDRCIVFFGMMVELSDSEEVPTASTAG